MTDPPTDPVPDETTANPLDALTGSNVPVLSVSEISNQLKRTVEDAYGRVRVRGEISQPKRAASGHVYLTLKDADAVIDGVCWRNAAARLEVRPEEGLEVVCTGRLTTYPGRSKYQIVIEQMALAGEGALLKMLEQRRRKLAAEGLFDEARKAPLPALPEVIGIVTSPTGAVIRDILHRLADRFPRHVVLWPVIVQGPDAAAQVSAAIRGFNEPANDRVFPRPDLLIVARGGGSLEDLMAFNEEAVVRAIAASTIPVISAIGHETDTTLADYVADHRAPTPTAAAERAVPVRTDLIARLGELEQRQLRAAQRLILERQQHLDGLGRGLIHPARLLEGLAQRLDTATERFDGAARRFAAAKAEQLANLGDRLYAVPLTAMAAQAEERLGDMGQRFTRAARRDLTQRRERLEGLASRLEAVSHKAVLARGYTLVRDEARNVVAQAATVPAGAAVTIVFQDGERAARIDGGPRDAVGKPGTAVSSKAGTGKPSKAAAPPPQNQGRLF